MVFVNPDLYWLIALDDGLESRELALRVFKAYCYTFSAITGRDQGLGHLQSFGKMENALAIPERSSCKVFAAETLIWTQRPVEGLPMKNSFNIMAAVEDTRAMLCLRIS